jgi:hypothetical protein
MRILALTWTTEDHELPMINARGDLWCPAIDGITNELLKLGHQVVYVNLLPMKYELTAEQLKCKAFISGLPYHTWDEIKNKNFDLIWHSIKDPTPPQAIEFVEKVMAELDPKIPILNHINKLKDHNKRKYIPVLNEYGVGVKAFEEYKDWLLPDGMIDTAKCFPPSQAAYVSLDKKAIRCPLTNSQRFGHLFKEDGGITLHYRDNEGDQKEGFRTIFRVPYACGKVLDGFRYICPAEIMCPKTGSAAEVEEFSFKNGSSIKAGLAMDKLGVDLAMLEGLEIKPDRVEIFDINPFPSSEGRTLTPLAAKMAKRIEQVYDL